MRALLLLTMVLAGGCKKSEPGCEQVVDNMLVVTQEQIARSGTAPNKKGLIAECENRQMTPKQKSCMAKAQDLEELAGCTGKKPQAPRDRTGYEPGPGAPDPEAPQMTDDPHALPLGHPAVTNKATPGPVPGSGSSAGSGSAKQPPP